MSRNTLIGRLFTPGGFALALGLFLLPFLTMSCAGPSTPSEDMPISSDVAISASFTGLDLIVNGNPTVELREGGQTVTIDASGIPEDPTAEREPVPTKIRVPMIGAASALLLGLVLAALIRAATVRRSLAAILALAAAGALAYVSYVSAPGYLEESAEVGPEGLPPGVTIETAPALGFWAIVGVLVVVLVLQVIPTPAAPAGPSPGTAAPPPAQYGAPAGSEPTPPADAGQAPVAGAQPGGQ